MPSPKRVSLSTAAARTHPPSTRSDGTVEAPCARGKPEFAQARWQGSISSTSKIQTRWSNDAQKKITENATLAARSGKSHSGYAMRLKNPTSSLSAMKRSWPFVNARETARGRRLSSNLPTQPKPPVSNPSTGLRLRRLRGDGNIHRHPQGFADK